MRLKTFLILFVIAYVALTMVNDYITYGLTKLNEESRNTQNEMQATTNIAEELLLSNQYTTRFARSYVATGDQKKKDFYQSILDILDGKVMQPKDYSEDYWDRVAGGLATPPDRSKAGGKSIEEIFLNLHITNEEFNKLKDAKTEIYEISKIEAKAMNIADEHYSNKQQILKNKATKTDLQPAIDLLYNKDYEVANAEVAQKTSEFKTLIKKRFTDQLT